MSNHWVVTERLPIGKKVEGQKYVRCNPLILSNGDFVDVAVELDIATSRTANGVTTNRVHLSMQHVIQLVTAEDVSTVRHRTLFYFNPGWNCLKLVLQHQLASADDSIIPCAGPVIQHTVFDFDNPVGDDLEPEDIEQLHI